MDNDTNTCVVGNVRGRDERDGEDVVPEHLVVVLAGLLSVDGVDLVEPPAQLGEVVELCEPGDHGDGVCSPHLLWRERRWCTRQNGLALALRAVYCPLWATHQSEPKEH